MKGGGYKPPVAQAYKGVGKGRQTPSQATRFARAASYPALAPALSEAGNGASGGATRAQPASLWICASVDLTPETSALPSNSFRIVTAASSAAVSPEVQACWQRSALR
jgi:hypothetical protein